VLQRKVGLKVLVDRRQERLPFSLNASKSLPRPAAIDLRLEVMTHVCTFMSQIRLEPLGLDRRHNRYWRFLGGSEARPDPAPGRLFFESAADGSFQCVHLTSNILLSTSILIVKPFQWCQPLGEGRRRH